MKWAWRNESDPPAPKGVAAVGAASRRLFDSLSRLDLSRRERLMLTAGDDTLVVTGADGALPWADGVIYIAPREEAPGLWLATAERPDVALDLLEQALSRRHGESPLLLLREPARVLPLHRLLPAGNDLLRHVRGRWAR